MIDFLRWALQKHERTKETARNRLQLILVLDRIGISIEHLDAMKADIIEAVSRYLVVDEDSIEMEIERSDTSLVLVSNIQVRDVARSVVAQ